MERHIEVLEKLLKEVKYGDEYGMKPDLTDDEIEAVEWAINKLKN